MNQRVIIDKNMLGILILLSMSLSSHFLYGQCSLDKHKHVIYKYDSTSLQYTEMVIKNISQDTIYLWIDSDVVYNDSLTFEQNNNLFFLGYIRNPHGELGLRFLCTDLCINFSGRFPPLPIVGSTFIKKLSPDESFGVFSLNEETDESSIHYVKQDFVAKIFKTERLDEFCYDKSYIIVW